MHPVFLSGGLLGGQLIQANTDIIEALSADGEVLVYRQIGDSQAVFVGVKGQIPEQPAPVLLQEPFQPVEQPVEVVLDVVPEPEAVVQPEPGVLEEAPQKGLFARLFGL
ncbi:MAG: hypothetical protein ACK5NY_03530 [Burkholderiaceae bacterium]|jgi:hypothetical protein